MTDMTAPVSLDEPFERWINPDNEKDDAYERQKDLSTTAVNYPEGSAQRASLLDEAQREADRWDAWKSCRDTVRDLASDIIRHDGALSAEPNRHRKTARQYYTALTVAAAAGTGLLVLSALPVGSWWMTLAAFGGYALAGVALRHASAAHRRYATASDHRTRNLRQKRRRLRSLITAADNGMRPSLASYVDGDHALQRQESREHADVFTSAAR